MMRLLFPMDEYAVFKYSASERYRKHNGSRRWQRDDGMWLDDFIEGYKKDIDPDEIERWISRGLEDGRIQRVRCGD